jgi:hypothetical protein
VRHCRLHACAVSIAGPSSPDFTDNDATGSDLCDIVKDLANIIAVGLINRSGARLRQVRP